MLSRFARVGRSIAVGSLSGLVAAALLLGSSFIVSYTGTTETIDEATEQVLALTRMEVALAEESRQVAVWVADERAGNQRLSLVDTAAGPVRRFSLAAQELAASSPSFQELGAVHDELLASMERLDALAATGARVATVYAVDHRSIEESLQTRLHALEAAATTMLELALLDSAAARDRLVSLLPVILLTGIAAVYALWRLRLTRRRADTLQQLIDEKDVFIGTVSHELRTPLTGILGLTAELVQHGESFTPADRTQYQEVVLAQALEMRDLIEDLLVAAHSDIEKIGIRPTDLDLSETVRRVLSESALMQSAEAPTVEVGEGTSLVRADRMRFRQILRNLLSNAARYGGARVSIAFSTRGGVGCVAVRDDGDGVPPGSEHLIFEPYQSAAGPNRPSSSVGLGLSVSRSLARLMGGDLVYRREDAETVFELSLPLVAAVSTPPLTTTAAANG